MLFRRRRPANNVDDMFMTGSVDKFRHFILNIETKYFVTKAKIMR